MNDDNDDTTTTMNKPKLYNCQQFFEQMYGPSSIDTNHNPNDNDQAMNQHPTIPNTGEIITGKNTLQSFESCCYYNNNNDHLHHILLLLK